MKASVKLSCNLLTIAQVHSANFNTLYVFEVKVFTVVVVVVGGGGGGGGAGGGGEVEEEEEEEFLLKCLYNDL